jgi:chromosome partitioning protein
VGKEYKLTEALESVKGDYDYIIIDTPPALSILTVNALTVADKVIIPAQADLFSLEAIRQLNSTIQTIKRYTNKNLSIAGILLTRYNNRNILTQELTEVLNTTAEYLQTKVFKSTIREAVAIKESQTQKQDIFTYSPESNVAGDYMNLVEEVIKDSIRN